MGTMGFLLSFVYVGVVVVLPKELDYVKDNPIEHTEDHFALNLSVDIEQHHSAAVAERRFVYHIGGVILAFLTLSCQMWLLLLVLSMSLWG